MTNRWLQLSMVAGVACAVLPLAGQGRGGRGGAPVNLPEGPGKQVVETHCQTCHTLNNIVNSGGYSRDGWITLTKTMIALPDDQRATVAEYLASHFPEQPRPAAVIVPGPVKVTFKEWLLPTLGSRPHDPLSMPDGTLWYTGQFANRMGRVNTKTGEFKEYPIPVEASGPHGLTGDSDGNIWFTANGKGYIGRLNPATGQFTEYKLPEGCRDPHTPIFDQKGTLWFTAQGSNMVGRLDPKTGDVKVATSPTPRSNPYGIVVSSKGVPFFVEFGTNKIGSIDPQTMAITEYVLPNEGTRPRRVAITSDDVLWYADYSRGYLGRFDPKTGQTKERPSPGGPRSQPYGITTYNDIIWYSESFVRPNTIVRFDPKTEKFQTWTIPSGGGVVRNMMATKEGNLVIAESGVNKVALVEVAR
jgi:virginiamycin B lyase